MPHPPHPTASRTEAATVLRNARRRPSPLFLPAIYEHKAWFIRSTPSAISRDPHLLTRALLAEFEMIGPDALTVGVDVYNVEAEAAGCTVTFYKGADTSIPGIKPGDHLIRVGDDLTAARIPDPRRDGRMAVNLRAASNVRKILGDRYWTAARFRVRSPSPSRSWGRRRSSSPASSNRSGCIMSSPTPTASSRPFRGPTSTSVPS